VEAFGHIIQGYFQIWEGKFWRGARETEKALFSSRCAKTQPCCSIYSVLSLCQNYFWLQKRKCLLCGLVHWSHAVFPPSKSTVLSPKWLAYFPCNTRLKKDQKKSRGKGESVIICGFTCSQLLGQFKESNNYTTVYNSFCEQQTNNGCDVLRWIAELKSPGRLTDSSTEI